MMDWNVLLRFSSLRWSKCSTAVITVVFTLTSQGEELLLAIRTFLHLSFKVVFFLSWILLLSIYYYLPKANQAAFSRLALYCSKMAPVSEVWDLPHPPCQAPIQSVFSQLPFMYKEAGDMGTRSSRLLGKNHEEDKEGEPKQCRLLQR